MIFGQILFDLVRFGPIRLDLVRLGPIRSDSVGVGQIRLVLIRFGRIWSDFDFFFGYSGIAFKCVSLIWSVLVGFGRT